MEFAIILWLGYMVYLGTRNVGQQQSHLLLLWIVMLAGIVMSVLYQLFRHS